VRQRRFRLFIPKDLGEGVMSERIVRVPRQVPGDLAPGLLAPAVGVSAGAGTIPPRGFIARPQPQIVVVGGRGVFVIAGVLGGPGQQQYDLGTSGSRAVISRAVPRSKITVEIAESKCLRRRRWNRSWKCTWRRYSRP
jgi:hypothetical protein